jgi:anti-sigma B factor antagonist
MGPGQSFGLSCRTADNSTVVEVCGEVDLATAPQLRDALADVVEVQGSLDVALDFSATSFLDSTGIAVVVAALKALREKGGRLHVSAASSPVRKVLEISGLLDILSVPDA